MHLCEFGYVITDINFNVLETENITINPEKPFSQFSRIDRDPNFKLNYPESVYRKSYKFPHFFEKIKSIIEYPDQIIIGHAISNDALFLNTACKRYDLESINFKFFDTQKMFSEYFNFNHNISLKEAGIKFHIELPKIEHRGDADALYTMELLRNMAESIQCAVDDLIYLCDTCSGENKDYCWNYYYKPREKAVVKDTKERNDNSIRRNNYYLFHQFLDGVKPQGDIINSKLTGKKICISMNYEVYHFREMLSIIQLIVNQGGEYRLKASLNDIFVSYSEKDDDGNEIYCSRLKYVNEAISLGSQIEIITFEELLELLNTDEKSLLELLYPDDSSFCREVKDNGFERRTNVKKVTTVKKKRERKSNSYIESEGGFSIGELLGNMENKE